MHATNYRDCQAWRDEHMSLNTSSNEAAKMYDAAVKQMCTRQDDKTIGGTEGSVEKMFGADPNFLMGHIYVKCTGVSGAPDVSLSELSKKQWNWLSDMEKYHCTALEYYSTGQSQKACDEWTKILNEYPKDVLALKMLYDTQIYLGQFEQQRDIVAKVLPSYKKKVDLEYGYMVGMHAFSLEETKSYDAAEKQAKEALECDRHDAWASHARAHVFEMTGRYKEGIDFLASTQKDWEVITGLKCHIHWHSMLYYIEKGDVGGALDIYDSYVASKASQGMFELSDAASALYRLKMQGVDVGKQRWKDLSNTLTSHMNDHGWAFYDSCVMAGLCGAQMEQPSHRFLQTVKDLTKDVTESSSDMHRISKAVNQYICEAIVHFENGEYEQSVEVLLPHKDNIIQIGGSHAQRDVFYLLLIHAATKSQNKQHNQAALKMLQERKTTKDTPLTQQLLSKIVVSHDES